MLQCLRCGMFRSGRPFPSMPEALPLIATGPEMLGFVERVAADGHESIAGCGMAIAYAICVEAAALVAKAKGEDTD